MTAARAAASVDAIASLGCLRAPGHLRWAREDRASSGGSSAGVCGGAAAPPAPVQREASGSTWQHRDVDADRRAPSQRCLASRGGARPPLAARRSLGRRRGGRGGQRSRAAAIARGNLRSSKVKRHENEVDQNSAEVCRFSTFRHVFVLKTFISTHTQFDTHICTHRSTVQSHTSW